MASKKDPTIKVSPETRKLIDALRDKTLWNIKTVVGQAVIELAKKRGVKV